MKLNNGANRLYGRRGNWLLIGLVGLVLAACGPRDTPPREEPAAIEITATSAADAPIATDTPVVVAAATEAEATETPAAETGAVVSADPAALTESLAAEVPLRAAGAVDGFDGVNAFAVAGPGDDNQLWVAHTYGMRVFQPDLIPHFVAVFDDIDGAWTELARIELECADYVDVAGVNQAPISNDSLWITVDGGAGAHSGCFDLLRWDGSTFVNLVQGFNSSPGAGDVVDLDGDGQVEAVLNGTDPYVFCYACGVRLYAAQILRWDGSQLTPVSLTLLPEDAPADVRDLNNRAVELANADLYHQALPLIEEALALAADNPVVYWNAQEIRLYAQNRQAYIDGGYPILSTVFYGDYAAAVELMRDLTPNEIFSLESPLIAGTTAEAWIPELSQYLIAFTDRALAVEPELAEAYFLRAWGRYLVDPNDPAVGADLTQAAQLAPDDALIQAANEEISAQ